MGIYRARTRRRWRRGLVVALAAVLLIVGGGLGAAWAYERSLDHNLARTNAFAGLPSDRPTETVTGALNFLVLGSDSRDPSSTADSRTDTIMLVHVDADHQHAYAISIPRDTWVYVPRSTGGGYAKINAAYAWGGTPLMVRTVERFTGVRVDHVILVDFAGFARITDALGGVDMYVDQTITSIHPPYRKFTKGEHHFTGAEALDYVRQRYQFADGDFTREKHQQQFLTALMSRAASTGTLADPVKLNAFLQAVTKSVTVDEHFDLVDTAMALRDLRARDVTFLTSPSAGTATVDGQSVVTADTTMAKALYRAVAADTVAQWVATNPRK